MTPPPTTLPVSMRRRSVAENETLARAHRDAQARRSSPPLEELDGPFMPFRGCPCAERTQVPPPAGLRIGLLRVQAIFAGCELPNHVRLPRLGEQGLYPARECRAMGIGYVWRWRDRCSSITASCVWRSWSARRSSVRVAASSHCATLRSSRAISLSNCTSTGAQLALLKIEYAIRRSSGALKYSSRFSGRPAPGRFSNCPCSSPP